MLSHQTRTIFPQKQKIFWLFAPFPLIFPMLANNLDKLGVTFHKQEIGGSGHCSRYVTALAVEALVVTLCWLAMAHCVDGSCQPDSQCGIMAVFHADDQKKKETE